MDWVSRSRAAPLLSVDRGVQLIVGASGTLAQVLDSDELSAALGGLEEIQPRGNQPAKTPSPTRDDFHVRARSIEGYPAISDLMSPATLHHRSRGSSVTRRPRPSSSRQIP